VARIVVAGAGIAGLGVALAAGRAGHRVTLVERDDTPLPTDAHAAFDWDRHGAPQVRHSHAFLARLRNLLRDRYPDVLAELLAAGASPLDFIAMLPEGMDRTPVEGDDDLVALACRRTTFEWVLRRIVLAGDTELRHGVAVRGLRTRDGSAAPPLVTGVELDDGTTLDADVVVLANGRRSDPAALLRPHGVEVPERSEDTGIVYFSRFFRLLDGADYPPQVGPIGGDLGHLKFGVFPGDNRTFSVTLAAHTHDADLRRRLQDPDAFLRAAAAIPTTRPYVEADRAEPFTEVHLMAGLLNRRRWFTTDDGAPRVLGLHAVGDAHTCTNPLYGRGCSLAIVQAQLLADALADHDLDHEARALAFESSSEREVTPWYRAAVAQDRLDRSAADLPAGPADLADDVGTDEDVDGPVSREQAELARSILRDGLFPALRSDSVVLRAFLRMLNLLSPPDALVRDGDVVTRVMQVYARRGERPPEAPAGPERDELLQVLSPEL